MSVDVYSIMKTWDSWVKEIQEGNAEGPRNQFRKLIEELTDSKPVAIVAVAPPGVISIGWMPGVSVKHNDLLYSGPDSLTAQTLKDASRYQVLRKHWFDFGVMHDVNTTIGSTLRSISTAGDLETLDAVLDKAANSSRENYDEA